jgi:nitrate reductase NapAB chaperone NapD
MHFSGIHVTVRPSAIRESVDLLESCPGVEVHYCYPESGSLIVVLETRTLAEQEGGFQRIRDCSFVLAAELVYYYDDSKNTTPSIQVGS